MGGLEKQDGTGNVSYDAPTIRRWSICEPKVANVRTRFRLEVVGPESKTARLVLSWGGTYGSVATACTEAREHGIGGSRACVT